MARVAHWQGSFLPLRQLLPSDATFHYAAKPQDRGKRQDCPGAELGGVVLVLVWGRGFESTSRAIIAPRKPTTQPILSILRGELMQERPCAPPSLTLETGGVGQPRYELQPRDSPREE